MDEQRTPAEVFSLAEHLYDEMIARGWKTENAAVRMHTKHGAAMDLFCLDLMMCVQDDNLILDDEFLSGLGRAFGVDPQTLRNIHDGWLKHPDRRSPFVVPEEVFGPTSRRAMIRAVR